MRAVSGVIGIAVAGQVRRAKSFRDGTRGRRTGENPARRLELVARRCWSKASGKKMPARRAGTGRLPPRAFAGASPFHY